MARTKGALNKRTRAALSEAAEGKLATGAEKTINQLLEIANDTKRDLAVRMQAANTVLPYVKPRLASIEQTNIDQSDLQCEEDITNSINALASSSPDTFLSVVRIVAALPGMAQRIIDAVTEAMPVKPDTPSESVAVH